VRPALTKAPTGVGGLDEITLGGLPHGRTTLLCGGPGTGKTLLGLQFLIAGAEADEPGVLVSFEETSDEIATNAASLGWDLDALQADGRLALDHVRVDPSEMAEVGEYDLEGLFARLAHATEKIGARRIVIDTVEVLFGALEDQVLLRSELRRLFRWLAERGLTAIVTGERGGAGLTRHGLEEYVSDCVIALDQRVSAQLATRLLRVVKYRGSSHGADEYPFLISDRGFAVLPASSMALRFSAPEERVSSGVPGLDSMLGGDGYFRGSTVLVTGTPGAGKTSLSASFAVATASRGERTLYLAYEESPEQISRNMRSIGLDLASGLEAGHIVIEALRPTAFGLETHVARLHDLVERHDPAHVIIDPLSAFSGDATQVDLTAARMIHLLKARGATAILTSLTSEERAADRAGLGISSLIDTWILVSNIESGGERNRAINVLKSRGTGHSNQLREFVLSDEGISIVEPFALEGEVLMGSARMAREQQEGTESWRADQELERRRRRLERRREMVRAQITQLELELEAETQDLEVELEEAARLAAQRQAATEARLRRRTSEGGAATV
jgi:circadian clock protein KaiC